VRPDGGARLAPVEARQLKFAPQVADVQAWQGLGAGAQQLGWALVSSTEGAPGTTLVRCVFAESRCRRCLTGSVQDIFSENSQTQRPYLSLRYADTDAPTAQPTQFPTGSPTPSESIGSAATSVSSSTAGLAAAAAVVAVLVAMVVAVLMRRRRRQRRAAVQTRVDQNRASLQLPATFEGDGTGAMLSTDLAMGTFGATSSMPFPGPGGEGEEAGPGIVAGPPDGADTATTGGTDGTWLDMFESFQIELEATTTAAPAGALRQDPVYHNSGPGGADAHDDQ
jgi:hypothetical protein